MSAYAEHLWFRALAEDDAPDVDDLLALLAEPRPPWMAGGLCREHPEVEFFPSRGQSTAPAKALCARCAVADACRAYVATFDPQEGEHGIWGGTSGQDRRRMRQPRQVEPEAA